MTLPMLADFTLRLACGLGAMLVVAPWRAIPPGFFRTHGTIALALLVLAGVDAGWSGAGGWCVGAIGASAFVAYLATIAWGLGVPRLALPLSVALAALPAGVLVAASGGPTASWLVALNASGRLASAFLLGSSMTAMLLGHYYLTAPAMSIAPLRRFVGLSGLGLALRAALAAAGWGLLASGQVGSGGDSASPLFLAMRWGMGVAGPALATVLAWKTVQIRSTQSATGILYIGVTLVLFGELSALILSRTAGVVL
jgi:hypothetical protein